MADPETSSAKSPQLIPTRWSLLSRLKSWQDNDSWQTFFDTYWRLIYGFAIKAGLSESEAQDVVQETVITVAKKLPGFKTRPEFGSFKGWLLHITRWRIADQFRKRGREVLKPSIGSETDSPLGCEQQASFDLDSVWETDWQSNLLDRAVERLRRNVRPEHFQIFDLCVLKQWPVAKAAAALDISSAKIYLVKHRLTERLKREVRRLEKHFL